MILWILLTQLCVNDERAFLREGPGTQFEKTWEVIRYMPLERVGKKGGWYEVKDVDSKAAWIREDLVTTKFPCAVVKEEFTNLRTGPGTNFPLAKGGRGGKYLSFRVLEERGRWIELEDVEGDVAWAARENLWMPR